MSEEYITDFSLDDDIDDNAENENIEEENNSKPIIKLDYQLQTPQERNE